MKKEEQVEVRYMRISTTFIIAVLCLMIGFLTGFFYKGATGTTRKARKLSSVQPPVNQVPTQQKMQQQKQQHQIQLQKEITVLEQQVKENPKNAGVWAKLGHNYFDTNQVDKAIAAYNKHLELKPDNADVWTDLGVMYRRAGKPQEALKAFGRAGAIDPNHQTCRFNIGVVYLHDLNDPAGALKAWEELVKINPGALSPSGQSMKVMVEQLRKTVGGEMNR